MADQQNQRRFEGVWIPRNVWLAKDLTLQEKVMLVEISSLSKGDNGCYANNRYFADFFGLSVSRVSEVINSLETKGRINIIRSRNGAQKESRNIFINNRHNPSVCRTHPSENRIDPSGKAKDNNTLNNTDKDIGQRSSFAEQSKELESAFAIYWSAGMLKTNKKKALSSFASYVKANKLCPTEFANMLAKDVKARLSANQMGFDRMHPTTYLNGERWEDQIVQNHSDRDKAQKPVFTGQVV